MSIKRYAGNPVLASSDLPYPSALVFNAGVTKYRGQYVMVFRNDVGFTPTSTGDVVYTNLGIALSQDGKKWQALPRPWMEKCGANLEIRRFYDPRLTVIDDRCYICFAVDTSYGVCGGIGVINDDFSGFEILSLSAPDNRNMVLFPDKINGEFVRLERPFPEYSLGYKERYDIWLSSSPDARNWGNTRIVLSMKEVPFTNSKIGPAAPPIRTSAGYLTTFHATWKDPDKLLNCWKIGPNTTWYKTYYAGLMLLDLNNPSKVIGMCRKPLLNPSEKYELEGFRGSVIFPGGMILEDDGEVKIYYGAADTVECLAYAHVDELLAMCEPVDSNHFNLNSDKITCKSPFGN